MTLSDNELPNEMPSRSTGSNRAVVKDFIEEWASQKTDPGYAVLIEGHWGSGKTHFVKSLIKAEEIGGRQPIYLPLFGLSSVEQLDLQLSIRTSSGVSRAFRVGGRLMGQAIQKRLSDSAGVGVSVSDLKELGIHHWYDRLKERVLRREKEAKQQLIFLDDIERCEIDPQQLFGYVNNLIEHGQMRVVLIANAERLVAANKSIQPLREKLVGQSFRLEGEVSEALDAFIHEREEASKNDFAVTCLKDHRSLLLDFHSASGLDNLRVLRQVVMHLHRHLSKFEDRHQKNPKLLHGFIWQFYVFYLEFKLGIGRYSKALSLDDLQGSDQKPDDRLFYDKKHYESAFDRESGPTGDFETDTDDKRTAKRQMMDKYDLGHSEVLALTFGQWRQILENGVVDADDLNGYLIESTEARGLPLNWPEWKRLWHFDRWDLTDEVREQLKSDLQTFQASFNNGDYREIGPFLHAAGLWIKFSKEQLVSKSKKPLEQQLCDAFDRSVGQTFSIESVGFDFRSESGFDSLGFAERDTPEFEALLNHVNDQFDAYRKHWETVEAPKWIVATLPKDYESVVGELSLQEHGPGRWRFRDKAVLHHIDVEHFVDAWLSLDRWLELMLPGNLKGRCVSNEEIIDNEGPWWEQVAQELTKRRKVEVYLPRKAQLSRLEERLQDTILKQIIAARKRMTQSSAKA